MRALYQERGSSEEDDDESDGNDEDFLDKVRNKMSGMFNSNKKEDVENLKKQANAEFL